MIVACSACSARFRVADEKIGPRGARVRCSRCGATFSVAPPGREAPAQPPATPRAKPAQEVPAQGGTAHLSTPPPTGPLEGAYPEEPTASHGEKTSTGGWPTGVLELQGTSSMDAPPPASLAEDPFAAYAAAQAPQPEPTPIGLGLPPPRGASATGPLGSGPGEMLASLAVTALSDLEKTASTPLPLAAGPAEPPPAASATGTTGLLAGQDLSLEERTPVAPLREAGGRWSEPEATNAVAIGPDGFQEVDLSSSATPPDPAFDHLDPEPTPPGAPGRSATPPPRSVGPAAAVAGDALPEVTGATASQATGAVRTGTTGSSAAAAGGGHVQGPARLRGLAMNVLSLAALLVVTAGILLWWRGGGLAGMFRFPGGAPASPVEIADVSSGIYGGDAGQPVVFVRGVVRATQGPVDGPVVVRVDLVRGERAVGTTTAVAGAVPWPEELAALATPEDVERLRARTASRGAPRLDPGAGLPFVAFLPQPPGDAAALSFRVEPLLAAGR